MQSRSRLIGRRVRLTPDNGEPGPWVRVLDVTPGGRLLVEVDRPDMAGGPRLASWPVVGHLLELEDSPPPEVRP